MYYTPNSLRVRFVNFYRLPFVFEILLEESGPTNCTEIMYYYICLTNSFSHVEDQQRQKNRCTFRATASVPTHQVWWAILQLGKSVTNFYFVS